MNTEAQTPTESEPKDAKKRQTGIYAIYEQPENEEGSDVFHPIDGGRIFESRDEALKFLESDAIGEGKFIIVRILDVISKEAITVKKTVLRKS